MSDPGVRTNVELLREGTEAYNRGDLSFVFERAADDIEVHTADGLLNTGTHHGRDAFARWMQEWLEAWSDFEIEIRSVDEIAERFLIVEVMQRGTGTGSGIAVEMELVQLIDVRGGEIARLHLYTDRAQAMATVERLLAESST